MKNAAFIVDVLPVRREVLTPAQYLELAHKSPSAIEQSQFVPPSFGSSGFGGFSVRYRRGQEPHRMHDWAR